MLGGYPIGFHLDALDSTLINPVLCPERHESLDGRLKVAAARVRLHVAIGDPERDRWWQIESPLRGPFAGRKGLKESVGGLNDIWRPCNIALREQRSKQSFSRRMTGM